MREVIITTEEEFDGLDKSRDALVLFTAPAWCAPCQRFEPHWNKAMDMVDMTFVKVDMGSTPEDTGEHWATARFGIMGVPQVKLFKTDAEPRDIKSRAVVPLIKEITNG